jgi:hypothetical protein
MENLKGDNAVDGSTYSITNDIKETWHDDVDWTSLAQVWVQRHDFVNLELGFRISQKAGISRLAAILLLVAYLLKKDYFSWNCFVNV